MKTDVSRSKDRDHCNACGACAKCDRCSHCGNCRNCGRPVILQPVIIHPPYPIAPLFPPVWVEPGRPWTLPNTGPVWISDGTTTAGDVVVHSGGVYS